MNTRIVAGLMSAVLVGCGGGGDEPGSPGSGTPNPGTQTRPDFAQPVYNGRTAKVAVDHAAATDIAAVFALALATVSEYLSDGLYPSIPDNQTIDRTDMGPDGGSVRLQGYGDAFRFGWLSATFNAYATDGTVLNGRLTEHRLRDEHGVEFVAISYHALRIRTGTLPEIRVDGTIKYEGPSPTITNTHDLSLTSDGETLFLRNLIAVFDYPTELFDTGLRVAVEGDVLQSGLGLFTVRTDTPMALSSRHDGRVVTGQAQLTGDGAVRFMPLNNHFVALEYAALGGDFTRAVRREWDQLADGAETATPMVGDPGIRQSWTSIPIKLDARFSHGGADGIQHTWSLVFGAPGEHAWLDHPQGAVVRFQPGGPGEYLLRLSSTDGVSTRESYIVHEAVEGFVTDPPPFREHHQLGPAQFASVGDEVSFDTRLYISRSGDPAGTIGTQVDAPPASAVDSATVSEDGERASFIPDVSGRYRLMGAVDVFVDIPRHFAPVVRLNVEDGSLTGQNKRDVAEISLADARALLYLTGSHSGLGKLFLTELDGEVSFRPTVVLGEFTMQRLLVVDLDGDGFDDIVGVDKFALTVLDQQADGSFTVRASIPYGPGGSFGCSVKPDVVVGDLFERGDRALAVPCADGVYTFNVSAAGAISAGVFHATPMRPRALLTADLDGSGRGTLVFSHGNEFPTDAGFMVLHGNPDGTFDAPVTYTAGPGVSIPPLVTAADLDGSGRDELVATTHGEIIIVEHDATGTVVQTYTHTLLPSYTPTAFVIDDFDGQPGLEVAVASDSLSDLLRVFALGAAFAPTELAAVPIDNPGGSPFVRAPLRTWDFNGDGLRDLMILRTSDGLDIHLAERAITGP